MEIGKPAGSPVRVATRHSPCDSPAVSKRNIRQEVLSYQTATRTRDALREQFLAFVRIRRGMMKFLLWLILFVLCWPLALIALILYPLVWLILLPFRVVGIAVGGALSLVWAIVTLPARVLRAI